MELGHMVSLTDFEALRVPGADFVELLLFDGDDRKFERSEADLVRRLRAARMKFVHVQEFVELRGKPSLVDLSADDEDLRKKSVHAVEAARRIARSVGGAKVVAHPGGIRKERTESSSLRGKLAQSLTELGPEILLLENMPWYYWEKGSDKKVANLCVSVGDMAEFGDLVEGFTLDTSHGFLSRPEGDNSYCSEFLSVLGGRTLHVHASDAKAPDREGLQIGDGAIDFSFLSSVRVPILAEIWSGHANNGEGFRIGIERLRSLARSKA